LKLVRRSAIRPSHRRAATVSSDVPEHGKWLVTKGSTTTSWAIDGKEGYHSSQASALIAATTATSSSNKVPFQAPPRRTLAGIAAVAISDHMQAI
jgi:folate-dependent tRNA-U54 methylase TrmFO/GidA